MTTCDTVTTYVGRTHWAARCGRPNVRSDNYVGAYADITRLAADYEQPVFVPQSRHV